MKLATAGLLLLKDRKLLLAYSSNKQCFYLPGGKIDPGETAAQALCREIAEELNIHVAENELQWYTHISAPAYGEIPGTMMEQECFFIRSMADPVASAEIGKIKYFTVADYLQQPNTAPGAIMILEQLKRDGFID